jgi:hypothetical protein
MGHGLVSPSLSELAEEFKRLDVRRRRQGLSLSDADRYNTLFEQLSEALSACERKRKCDVRQFLRVQADMVLVIRRPEGQMEAKCLDFGGGGCALALSSSSSSSSSSSPAEGDDLWLDGAIIDGVRLELHGRGVIVWRRAHDDGTVTAGLRFAIDSSAMRDQIDRVLYRVLDRFLAAPLLPAATAPSSEAAPPPA